MADVLVSYSYAAFIPMRQWNAWLKMTILNVQALTYYTGISYGGYSINSAGAFFVLPVSALSSEYVVLTHCIYDTCFLTIAATAPGVSTIVSLQLQVTGVVYVSYGGQQFATGDVIHESLRQHQVIRMRVCVHGLLSA